MTAGKLLLAVSVAAGALTLMAPQAQATYYGWGYSRYPYYGYRTYYRPYAYHRPYYRYRPYGYYRPYRYRPAYYGHYGPYGYYGPYYGGPFISFGFGISSGW
jgi:hypothetical protein